MLKRFWMGILTILCSIGITIVISYAWFIKGLDVDPLATGSSTEAYYHSGTGTENDPFIITTPRHLYNFAWLQYLGAYNKDKKSGNTFPATYFKVGLNSSITIDMAGWPLPPIGTTQYPFIGNFNGNGSTITNLTTTNKFSEFGDKHPSGVDDKTFEYDNCGAIGFFGSVGAYDNSIISGDDKLGTYTYDTSNNKIYNFYLDDTNVHTSRGDTLIGAVAGYVNAKISDVGVIKPHLNIETSATSKLSAKTSNVSDFAVVGYAEAEYTTQKTKTSTIIYNPTYDYSHFNFQGMGSQADWGGSMDMQKLHARIDAVANSNTHTSGTSTYLAKEIVYGYDEDKTHITGDGIVTYTGTENAYTAQRLNYKNQGGSNGTYLKNYSQSTSGQYQCLTALYKDVYTINYNGAPKTGYKIRDDKGNYLSYNAINDEFETVTSVENATIWLYDETNHNLYTYDEEEFSTDIIRYLNGTTDLVTKLTTTSTTNWYWDENFQTFKYNYNNIDYYLNCISGVFMVRSNFVITDNEGNYVIENEGIISNTDDIALATKWIFSNNGVNPYGYILNTSNINKRLTISGNSLVTNETGTVWSYDGNNIFSGDNIIKYDGTAWTIDTISTYLIQYNGNYLRYNNGLTNTTTIDQATLWTLSNDLATIGGTGIISNGNVYLRYNNGLTTTNRQNQASTWAHDQYGIYYNNNGTKMYIQYSNGWKAQVIATINLSRYYITFDVAGRFGTTTNYLTRNGNSISNQTTASENALWIFSQSGNNPSGIIYQIVDNTYYYLNLDSSGPIISTTASHTFSNINGYLYDETSGYYLVPNVASSWWGNSFSGWTVNKNQPSNAPSYKSGSALVMDDIDNTPFGQFAAKVNFYSKCMETSIGLIVSRETTHDLVATKQVLASLYNCIPINAASSNPYSTDTNNTGYIMSGGYDTSINCDIRVSYFAQSYISKTWANSTWQDNSVYTIGTSGFGKIIESGNGSGTYYPVSQFSKFKNAKTQLIQTLGSSNNNVYGLHFMDAAISKNHIVTPTSILINGVTYNDYQMPEDCIDFNLKTKGSINCFSGYYFDGNGGTNNAFFSLHEIIRNDDKTINKILHIIMIYENKSNTNDNIPDGTYIYQYVNDDDSSDTGYYYYDAKTKQYVTLNSFNSSNNDLVFNKNWIEDPVSYGGNYNTTASFYNQYKNNLFYFEIPVNAGEYALGSVSGKTGTYLVYLDIGANASVVDRTTITQQSDVVNENIKYVNGIQILAASTTYTSDANSCVAVIKASTTGTIAITRTGNTVSFGGTSLDSTYWDDTLTVPDATLNVPKTTSTTKVLKYIDFNNGTNTLYYSTVIDVDETRTFEVREINGKDNPIVVTNESTQTEMEAALYGLLKIGTGDNAGYGVQDTAKGAITANSFTTTSKVVEYHYTIPTSMVTNNGVSYSFDMSVEQVTGTETVGDKTITIGSYTFDDGYTSTHCYKLIGDDITYVFTQIPAGTTTTTFVVTTKNDAYIVTINGTTITVGNYTYTFSTNTIV